VMAKSPKRQCVIVFLLLSYFLQNSEYGNENAFVDRLTHDQLLSFLGVVRSAII
jgi:hypothetical protein